MEADYACGHVPWAHLILDLPEILATQALGPPGQAAGTPSVIAIGGAAAEAAPGGCRTPARA